MLSFERLNNVYTSLISIKNITCYSSTHEEDDLSVEDDNFSNSPATQNKTRISYIYKIKRIESVLHIHLPCTNRPLLN